MAKDNTNSNQNNLKERLVRLESTVRKLSDPKAKISIQDIQSLNPELPLKKSDLLKIEEYNKMIKKKIRNKANQKFRQNLILILSIKISVIVTSIILSPELLPTVIPINAIAAAALLAHQMYTLYTEKKKYKKTIENEAINSKNYIYDNCLKNECKISFDTLDEVLNNIASYSDSEFNLLFSSREICLLEKFNFFSRENIENNQYGPLRTSYKKSNNLRTQLRLILKYFKEDKLKEFDHHFRIYCASKQIGEFKQSKTSFFSSKDPSYGIKKHIIENYIIEKDKKKFDEIKEKFYDIYKLFLMIYTFSDKVNEKVLYHFYNELNLFIQDRVKKDKNQQSLILFYECFRTYRYIKKECEFDRNLFFQIQHMKEFFTTSPSLKSILDEFLNLSDVKSAGAKGAFTITGKALKGFFEQLNQLSA